MKVLVFNAGSSSLKFGLFSCVDTPQPVLLGSAQNIGKQGSHLSARDRGGSIAFESTGAETMEDATGQIIAMLQGSDYGRPDVIGHRIVHGGPEITDHCLIDEVALYKLEQATVFAPLHGRPALAIVKLARAAFPVPQVACLDTAFHKDMPAVARRFPLPSALAARGLHRYGFHGLSCESILRQLADRTPSRLIVAHLGSGASVTAIRDGRSIDNTMGLTPTGGVMMATRAGDLDPGLLIYLVRLGHDAEQLETLLDQQSGLAGVSGQTGDFKTLAASDSESAKLAVSMFCYSITKAIAAMAAALGGLDLLVFAGGIGEHDETVRARIVAQLSWMGGFRQAVIPAQEEIVIARHAADLGRRALQHRLP
jgi:acetate kinase